MEEKETQLNSTQPNPTQPPSLSPSLSLQAAAKTAFSISFFLLLIQINCAYL